MNSEPPNWGFQTVPKQVRSSGPPPLISTAILHIVYNLQRIIQDYTEEKHYIKSKLSAPSSVVLCLSAADRFSALRMRYFFPWILNVSHYFSHLSHKIRCSCKSMLVERILTAQMLCNLSTVANSRQVALPFMPEALHDLSTRDATYLNDTKDSQSEENPASCTYTKLRTRVLSASVSFLLSEGMPMGMTWFTWLLYIVTKNSKTLLSLVLIVHWLNIWEKKKKTPGLQAMYIRLQRSLGALKIIKVSPSFCFLGGYLHVYLRVFKLNESLFKAH